MKIIDKESIKGKILYSLSYGTGILIALSNKRASYKLAKSLIREIFGFNPSHKIIHKEIYRLRKLKLVSIEKVGEEQKLVLTEEGKKIILRFNYENMKIKDKMIWDMKWRMVLFDIPDKKKIIRDSFRLKMSELGFVRFNNSVWVYPYPCKEEIDFIANYWGIGKYVQFAVVSKITNEEELRKHFRI